MKPIKTLTVVVASLTIILFAVFADEAKEEVKKNTPKELKNQTHCPVMGGVIDSTVYTDIQGQRVYHCCPMCSTKLKKDPDSFFKKAGVEGVLFENIQTVCAVCGGEFENKSVYADYEGRRIIFKCEQCLVDFNKDPQKYLFKMDESPVGEKDKEGHDHYDHEEDNH